MSIADVFYNANEQLRLENVIPVTKQIYKSIDKRYWNEEHQGLTYEKWKTLLKKHGYDIKKIMKNKNPRTNRQFFYVGDYYTVEINSLDPAWLLNEFTIGCLKANELKRQDFLNKEYILFFFPEWNLFAIDYFLRLYKDIEKEQLWEVFKSMYTHANYGFGMFPKEVLEEVFTYADNTSAVAVLNELGAVDSEGYLTLYRGEGKRSTPLEKAYSWTLSKDIANKFANHFERGRLYQAKAKVDSIIDFDNERNEEEVLVRFENIEHLEIIQDY
ncbi:hypothetical protein CVD28_03095 [Bacillus sp. M6-12]|uniref:hypothetical protein n=1 Tax=Bacillus sp. M6-12 TaxID=2054166 RepID=UPI000C76E8A2|nr:hypothetical protein [Bacillus sp. M6-12]PLS19416.1 hypothetical protein CVD28_03095 [Bacillus sp. M6-12]